MFRHIFHKLVEYCVTFFTQLSFTSLSSIMSYQAFIFSRLVLRLDLPEAEYKKGDISLGSLWSRKQRLGLLWTASKWIATLVGFSVGFGFLPTYACTTGRVLGLEAIEHLALSVAIDYVLFEGLWLTQLGPILESSRNTALDLLHFYAKTLKTPSKSRKHLSNGLNHYQITKLIRNFNRVHQIISVYCCLTLLGTVIHIFQQSIAFLNFEDMANYGYFQVFLNLLFAINDSVQGSSLVFFEGSLVSQGILLVRLFRHKLGNALAWLRHVPSQRTLRHFQVAYMSLNGEIRLYNGFMCDFIYFTDLALKLSGSFILLFFLASGTFFSNVVAFGTSLFLFLAYLGLNCTYTFFAVFSEVNLKVYQKVAGLYVKRHLRKRRRKDGVRWRNVRQALEMNGLVQFLASRQFGFTYGRQNVIEKSSILENVASTVKFFLLFIMKRY